MEQHKKLEYNRKTCFASLSSPFIMRDCSFCRSKRCECIIIFFKKNTMQMISQIYLKSTYALTFDFLHQVSYKKSKHNHRQQNKHKKIQLQ